MSLFPRASAWLGLGLCCGFVHGAWAQATLSQIQSNGPTDRRINIVVLSEGYTQSELAKFPSDAQKTVDHLLSTPPYESYSNFFNVFLISVASAQSGSDHPSRALYRDTYFNSSYDSYGLDRLLTIPPNDRSANYADGQGKVDALLKSLIPEYDIVYLVVNDPEYGGSGGVPALTSVNESASEILVHELGHSFADLGDEYADAYPGYPDTEEPNTTRQTSRLLIKWRDWISETTPIPTPASAQYAGVVGLFQGAHYHATDWYRPKLNCKMRNLDVPFCEVCREALVLAYYRLVNPIDAMSPSNNVIYLGASPLTLNLDILAPADHSLAITWTVNGAPVAPTDPTAFTIYPLIIGNGQYTIRAEVRDPTAYVRADSQNLLFDSHAWTVNILTPAPPVLFHPLRLGDGRFQLSVSNASYPQVIIQASRDFTNWFSLLTNKTANSFDFIDPEVPDGSQRFYRAFGNP